MQAEVRRLLDRLATDTAYADRFFANPRDAVAKLDLSPADRDVLAGLDREAVQFLAVVEEQEPERAEEHPSSSPGRGWVTAAIGLWVCAAYVVIWLAMGGAQ